MKPEWDIPPGASASRSIRVTREQTIAGAGEDLPAVLSTPAMIYEMEVTAAECLRPYLPEGWISVGVAVNIRHLAPTPEGATVRTRAQVTAVDGKTVTFMVEAFDEVEKIGEGSHVRAPVEKERFIRRTGLKLPK